MNDPVQGSGLFASLRRLLATVHEMAQVRLELLGTLRRVGPCSVYALAKAAERNYSNVHTDVARLEELAMISRSDDGNVSVPFESVEIRFPLAQVACRRSRDRRASAR